MLKVIETILLNLPEHENEKGSCVENSTPRLHYYIIASRLAELSEYASLSKFQTVIS